MDHHEGSVLAQEEATEVEPYATLKQILEEEAARRTAQERAAAQERMRRHPTTEQNAPQPARDTVRYGLD